MIWQANLDGIITYSSPGVRPLLGYQPTDLIGRSVLEVLAPEDHALGAAFLKSAQAGSGWHGTPAAWRHVDGHLVRLVGSAEPIVDSAGNVVGIRGVRSAVEEPLRDITAQRDGIRRVITERQLAIALQPIVDIGAGRWVGAEALARFRPTESVEVVFRRAQEVGLAEELEAAAAESAFALLDSLPASVYLAINLSPLALLHPAVQHVLDRHRDRFDRIVLELTEHVSVSDYDQVHEMLQPLRRHGLRFAIDDAGAGYASFLHVVRLRPDIIKLDRALVENMGVEPAKRAVARAVCTLASEINADVVAEGVETAEDMASAADVGLVLQQGYLFARPSTDTNDWAAWAARPWPHEGP